jgi:hypothetical protein
VRKVREHILVPEHDLISAQRNLAGRLHHHEEDKLAITSAAPLFIDIYEYREVKTFLLSLCSSSISRVGPACHYGAARDVVGIRRGAISGNMKVSFQAARSIG